LNGRNQLSVLLEGSEQEVSWLKSRVDEELQSAGATSTQSLAKADATAHWRRLVEFPDQGPNEAQDESPMVVKIAVPPSSVTVIIGQLLQFDAACTIQAHAGSGILFARFSSSKSAELTRAIVGKLRPAAVNRGGSLIVVRSREVLTPHVIWGGRTEATMLLERVKQQFDPRNILNPGRFAY
jgi:glycolate oxidase FAD binding subunit